MAWVIEDCDFGPNEINSHRYHTDIYRYRPAVKYWDVYGGMYR
jgi:hypothetical protein